MPGVMTRQQLQDTVSIMDITVKLRGTIILESFGDWGFVRDAADGRGYRDPDSPLLEVAEFAACVGPELAKEIVIVMDAMMG